MSRFLSGANRTAQYYQGSYPGASTFTRLDKFLIHTTETRGWPGYGGGASAPNATYFPERREIRQHFDNNRSARALRDPSGTAVRENRDNIFQLEVICYSSYSLVERFGGLWVGDLTDSHMRDIGEIANQLHRDWDLPLQSSVRWREGRRTFYDDVRLSGPQFDAYRGILGHVHASGNSHWDPGGFRYSQLARHLNDITEDDMPSPSDWNNADREAVRDIVESALRFPTFVGMPNGEKWNVAHVLGWLASQTGGNADRLARMLANQQAIMRAQGVEVDEQALATQIAAVLVPAVIASLPDTGLTEEQVEQALRSVLGSLDEN